ncbi:MAG: hypothetical protein FXF54_03280 [Kosmotoga sp.]|nr:MAG: hypothetical protein FXF54_03280 [Kosmotoga sp.]
MDFLLIYRSIYGKIRIFRFKKLKLIKDLLKKVDHETSVIWACECAERVLSYFEEKYPDDKRPIKAIEAGRFWIGGQIAVSQARKAAFEAYAAARDIDKGDQSAIFAARSAAHAAATVHVKKHAISVATYAAKAVYFSNYPDDSSYESQERV